MAVVTVPLDAQRRLAPVHRLRRHRPKWEIARYRILDAAAAAHSGEPVDSARLAAELGFADQPHLTRAFTRVAGTPPATYRREA